MKNSLRLFISLFLILSFITGGCTTSAKKRAAAYSSIETHENSPLQAFLSDGSLYIRYNFEGKKVYFAAKPKDQNTALGNYSVAMLEPVNPSNEILEGPQEDIIFVPTGFEKIVKNVFINIMPTDKSTGKVIIIQGYEGVLYKDEEGKAAFVDIEKTPKNIKITGGLTSKEFSLHILKELQKELAAANFNKTKFLFPIKGKPLEPYVYVDLANDTSVTLQLPEYYEVKKQMSELGFSISFIYSFFVKSHFFAIIKSPFTAIHRLFSLATSSLFSGLSPLTTDIKGEIPPINENAQAMDIDSFNKYLNQYISKEVYKADVNLLINGEEFFPNFIMHANRAKESVFIRLYIFGADQYTLKIADMLKAKSNEGTDIRILIDELNSVLNYKKTPEQAVSKDFVMPNIVKYLEKGSKINVRTRPNTWGTFDHSKVIIIDRELAYTGGMNFGEEYRYTWHDMMVSLRGPVVGRLVKNFYEDWSFAGPGGDFAAFYRMIFSKSERKVNEEKPGMIDVRLLYTKPSEGEIFKAQIEAIKRANKRIYIENAYFSDDRIVKHLIEARERGVDVRVILPGVNDISIMHKNNISMANKLLRNGIKVYFYNGMSHVKAAIYDNWALIGSANFDKMSLFINKEMSIGISDPKFVEELNERLFVVDFNNSSLMLEEIQMDWAYHIVDALTNQL